MLLPEDGDTYDFYVADQESYDSNLYRLPPNFGAVGTVAVPGASKEDWYNTASVGGDGQLGLGRQVLKLDLRADENRFDRNTVLNNTSYNGTASWNWRVGGHFSGQAGVDFNHSLASFDETRYLGRDLVNTAHYYGSARYQVGPSLALYGSINDSDITHSAQAAQFQNFRTTAGSGGIEYATSANDTVAFQYNYSDGRYPAGTVDTLNGAVFSPDFHDQLAQFVVKYAVSDKTQINANAGYIKRQYQNTAVGSFSGADFRMTLLWQLTGKTQFTVAGWRELHAYLVSESNYFISKGGSIGPVWDATEKINVSLLFSYEDQNYVPQSTDVLILGPLNAKLSTERVNITYTPRDNWIFKMAFNHQQRNSNQLSFQFTDELASVAVLYKFH